MGKLSHKGIKFTTTRLLRKKKKLSLTMPNVGKDMEKPEIQNAASGSENWHNLCGNKLALSS